jgi:nucleoside-diphosphate-sugar epimerase
MRTLVTGAAGFVGQAVVRRLVADGGTVRALVRPGDPFADELRRLAPAGRLEIGHADVMDAAALTPHFVGVDCVIHSAAIVHGWHPWERYRAVNVGGTQHVARAAHAAGAQRLVHVSTSDVFGIPDSDGVLDESAPYRAWHEPYPDTKIEAERWVWQFHRDTGLPVTVINPGWVYGPGDKAFFPSLARAIAGGIMCFWHRDTRLHWAYIDNLADAIVLAAAHPAAVGNGYLVHDGADGPTLEEVCARIAAAIRHRPPTRHLPYGVALAAGHTVQFVWRALRLRGEPPLLTNDVKSFGFQWRLSNAKVQRELGWSPRVSISDGMDAAIGALSR